MMTDRFFRVRDRKKLYIVTEHSNKYWSCDCSAWKAHIKIDCAHILNVKLFIVSRDKAIFDAIEEMKNLGFVSEKTREAYEKVGNGYAENKIIDMNNNQVVHSKQIIRKLSF